MDRTMKGGPLMESGALVIGHVGTHGRYPGRLCLMQPDGTPITLYGYGMSMTDVAVSLACQGRLLRDDDSVVAL